MSNYYGDESVKKIILSARNFFEQEKINGLGSININQVQQRTAECLGISVRTIQRVISEQRSSGTVSAPKPKSGRKKIELDEFSQGVLRRIIFNFYLDKHFPNVKEVYHKLRTEVEDLPEFSISTLYRWLHKLNFSYRKISGKPILMEDNSVAARRAEFLYDVKNYRESGWNIYYTDETWCGANHSKKFGWVERVQPQIRDNFDQYKGGVQQINGYRGGIKRPSE